MKKLPFFFLAFAAFLGGLSSAASAQNIKADAAAGEKKAAMCIGCHGIPGYQASFPEVHKVPMISGQGAKYIATALGEYQKGDRKHPTMRAIAATLTEQDIADLAAFYEQQPKEAAALPAKPNVEPDSQVAELLKKGNCMSCHGENFSKPIDGAYPKLAGQHADYLFVALKAYQTTSNPQIGRSNPIMMGMARPYTHAELKALAQYLASLPSELHTIPQSRFR
ncbi:MAG TPA: c-type cytochrome [Rhizobacter sp.]|nr:c-type cytochrome [Rhizobacter sp.]